MVPIYLPDAGLPQTFDLRKPSICGVQQSGCSTQGVPVAALPAFAFSLVNSNYHLVSPAFSLKPFLLHFLVCWVF